MKARKGGVCRRVLGGASRENSGLAVAVREARWDLRGDLHREARTARSAVPARSLRPDISPVDVSKPNTCRFGPDIFENDDLGRLCSSISAQALARRRS